MELKGYYLPEGLSYLEDEMDFKEIKFNRYTIKVPKVERRHIEEIVQTLRKNREVFLKNMMIDEIAESYDKVTKIWKNSNSEYKRIAMETLPMLTNLSAELIEFFQFSTIYKINESAIKFLADLKIDRTYLKNFVTLENANTYLRGFASFTGKLKLLSAMSKVRELKLITYITPKNVPGLIEALGIFLSSIAKASSITKTPSAQPIFAPLYANSIREINKDLGETMVVIPWKGGTIEIEDVLFRHSDAVSVVSSTETANSVKRRIDQLIKQGHQIKGCYHGGKFGLVVIGKEYATKDVAYLAAIDAIGYEGYMCSSPAFGFFVEEGGNTKPERFARYIADGAEKLSKIIPQTDYFRKLREKELAHILIESAMDPNIKVYNTSNRSATVVYYPKPKIIPNGQNRLIKVMPIKDIYDIFGLLKQWKEYFQTIGIAVSQDRLLKFAEIVGKKGFSNIRVVGTVTLPRLGEAWDGNLPVLEFYVDDVVHWISINTTNIDQEIRKLSDEIKKLIIGK